MILTNKQEQALKICIERYKNHEKYTCISGYAGTGKSTLVKFLVEGLGISENKVCYAAYTGKATQVLSKKGNKNVKTMHKLLYTSFPKPDGTFFRKPNPTLEPYKLIIVDEVSMIPNTLMELLFSHDVHVICCGDPFQLPPIDKDENNHLLDHPHIFLDEIMRQAQESEIIRLTMDIRGYKEIKDFRGNEAQVVDARFINTGMLQWADQILVGTNKTRITLNNQMRKLLNYDTPSPQEGDKVICCRNYWGELSDQEYDLINGTIGFLHNKFDTQHYIPAYAGGGTIDVTIADFVTDNGDTFNSVAMDTHMIMTGERCVDRKLAYRLMKNPRTSKIVPMEFTYGYAITVHRAQGSEWDKVLVLEESFPFNKEEHARWLYTACTRAADKLVLLR